MRICPQLVKILQLNLPYNLRQCLKRMKYDRSSISLCMEPSSARSNSQSFMNDLSVKADVSVLIICLTGPNSVNYSDSKQTGKDFFIKHRYIDSNPYFFSIPGQRWLSGDWILDRINYLDSWDNVAKYSLANHTFIPSYYSSMFI